MKIKRFTALVLSLMLQVSGLVPINAEEINYEYETNVIKSLEIIEEVTSDSFNAKSSISRAEFLMYVMQATGKEPISSDTTYVDIRPDYWAAGYIGTAQSMGIISGYSSNYFRPDKEITYAESVRMLLSALGYGGVCENSGGFPDGYMNTASRLEILDGISLGQNDVINKATAVKLIYNATEVPVMLLESLSGNESYTTSKDKNFLGEYHDIYLDDGIVEANDETSLSGNGMSDGTVVINQDEFCEGNTDAAVYLGMRIKYYYRYDKNEDEKTLLYIEEYKNEVKEFTHDLIKDFDGKAYTVYKYDRTQAATYTAKITAETDVIYNGRAITKYNEEYLRPAYGRVKLIDNDNDKEYDVAFIESYSVIVVQSYQAAVGLIYDKYNKSLTNLKLYDEYSICDEEGREISDSAIREYSVILLCESYDKSYLKLIVSNKSVSGSIASVEKDVETIAEINGERYKVGNRFPEDALSDRGRTSTYYMDAFGVIQAVKSGATVGTQYGYIVKGRMTENDDGNMVAWMKIFNHDGKFITATTSYEKLKLNGIQRATEAALETAICNSEKNIIPQIVGYRLNSDGEISMLDTVGTMTGTDDVLCKEISSSGRYKKKNATFSGRVGIASNAKIFSVPSDTDDTDEKSFSAVTLDSIPNDTDVDSFIGYRTIEESPLCDILIIHDYGSSGIQKEDTFAVVTKVRDSLNEDDMVVPVITMMKRGEIKDYTCEDEDVAKNIRSFDGTNLGEYKLGRGDTVKFALSSDGKIEEIELHYDYSEKKMLSKNNPANYTGTPGIMLMNVYNKYEDMIVTTANTPKPGMTSETGAFVYYKAGGYDIIVYDEELDEGVKAGSVADINDFVHNGENYSKAYIASSYGEPVSMVIYR